MSCVAQRKTKSVTRHWSVQLCRQSRSEPVVRSTFMMPIARVRLCRTSGADLHGCCLESKPDPCQLRHCNALASRSAANASADLHPAISWCRRLRWICRKSASRDGRMYPAFETERIGRCRQKPTATGARNPLSGCRRRVPANSENSLTGSHRRRYMLGSGSAIRAVHTGKALRAGFVDLKIIPGRSPTCQGPSGHVLFGTDGASNHADLLP